MDVLDTIFGPLLGGTATLIVVAVTLATLWALRWLRAQGEHPALRPGRFHSQLYSVLVVIVGTLGVILTLPLDAETRGQLLSLFGIVVTGMIALSGTTFVSNAMAGLMLRSLGNFHPGDFVRVAEHFGRVTERGLLHTEIQTEDRDLVTLPNLYLATQPVRVVRQSGTLVSCEVSLGYDLPRATIEEMLRAAAEDAGLTDAFVLVTDLGDHAVGWRVSGFLEDVKHLVSVRSTLRIAVMDRLHGAGLEIVSPAFMNQRQLDPDETVVAAPSQPTGADEAAGQAEAVMFDKAELVARLSELARQRDRLAEEIHTLQRAEHGNEAAVQGTELRWREQQLASLDRILEEARNSDGESD